MFPLHCTLARNTGLVSPRYLLRLRERKSNTWKTSISFRFRFLSPERSETLSIENWRVCGCTKSGGWRADKPGPKIFRVSARDRGCGGHPLGAGSASQAGIRRRPTSNVLSPKSSPKCYVPVPYISAANVVRKNWPRVPHRRPAPIGGLFFAARSVFLAARMAGGAERKRAGRPES